MPKFSANLGFLWTELPLPERIAAAGRAGFRAVELHTPYDHPPETIAEACRQHGVKLLGINTPSGGQPGDSGLAAVPGRADEARADIDRAFRYAHAAGGTAVHVLAGRIEPAQKGEARRALVETLRYAADHAEALGLVALIEPINRRNIPGYFYDSVEEAAAIAAGTGSSRVKIMFDCYHLAILQGDVIMRLRQNLASIGHVQIAAVPSRAEPDEGEIAYGAIFAELDALGYGGWVGCEYRPRAGTDAGLGWLETLGARL